MQHRLNSSSITRRTLVKSTLVAAGGVGFAATTPRLQATSRHWPRTELAAFGVPAHSQTVVQRWGVNIRPGDAKTEYAEYDKVASLLEQLGVRKVRSVVRANDPNNAMPYLASLNTGLGISVHGTACSFPLTDAQRSAMPQLRTKTATMITKYAGIFNSLGGYNEPNGTRYGPRPSWWLNETLTQQKWMWDLVHGAGASQALANIRVCGPSLHDQVKTLQQDDLDCSVLKPYMENINLHRYPSGLVPSTLIDQRTAWAAAGVGSMPVLVSEAGYNNGMNSNAYAPIPADVYAAYADRLLMEHVTRGNDVYSFELLNNYPPSSTNLQDFYGLVAVPDPNPSTWQPLPAFDTFRRFLGLMQDGDAAYSPAALPLTMGGASDVKSYLVGKRDGSYLLALWRDVSVWDRKTRTRLNPSAATATVTFDTPKTVSVYKPSVRDAAFSTAVGTTHSVSLQGNLALLKIAA